MKKITANNIIAAITILSTSALYANNPPAPANVPPPPPGFPLDGNVLFFITIAVFIAFFKYNQRPSTKA